MRTLCMNKDEVHLDVYYMMPWGELFFKYPLKCLIHLPDRCSRLCPHRTTHYINVNAQTVDDEVTCSHCIHPALKHAVLLGVHRNFYKR